MQPESREVEMPTYTMNYGEPVAQAAPTPFVWEGGNTVVINENFYTNFEKENMMADEEVKPQVEAPPQTEEVDFPDLFGSPHDEFDMLFGLKDSDTLEERSCPSMNGTSTKGSVQTVQTVPDIPSLDSQLDFIMGTARRSKKFEFKEKKHKRSKKSPGQLEVLAKELSGKTDVTKEMIREIAKKTGLTATQVYKWYWDHKTKA